MNDFEYDFVFFAVYLPFQLILSLSSTAIVCYVLFFLFISLSIRGNRINYFHKMSVTFFFHKEDPLFLLVAVKKTLNGYW